MERRAQVADELTYILQRASKRPDNRCKSLTEEGGECLTVFQLLTRALC
jgi:hypothetical protein